MTKGLAAYVKLLQEMKKCSSVDKDFVWHLYYNTECVAELCRHLIKLRGRPTDKSQQPPCYLPTELVLSLCDNLLALRRDGVGGNVLYRWIESVFGPYEEAIKK